MDLVVPVLHHLQGGGCCLEFPDINALDTIPFARALAFFTLDLTIVSNTAGYARSICETPWSVIHELLSSHCHVPISYSVEDCLVGYEFFGALPIHVVAKDEHEEYVNAKAS